jgi:hypothetical protein
MSMKNSNETIGNRTRDLPACRTVPQPTAPPRAPAYYVCIETLSLTVFCVPSFYTHSSFWYKFRNTFRAASCSVPQPTAYSLQPPLDYFRSRIRVPNAHHLYQQLACPPGLKYFYIHIKYFSSTHFSAVLNRPLYTYDGSQERVQWINGWMNAWMDEWVNVLRSMFCYTSRRAQLPTQLPTQ